MTSLPKSDHCDGQRFHNIKQQPSRGFWDLFKMLALNRFAKWPNWVDNDPALDLKLPLKDKELTVTFVNHATVLIQTNTHTILTDPVWAHRVSPLSWLGPRRVRAPGIPFESLPPITLVLISHNHYDHLDKHTLKALDQKFAPLFVAPLGNANFLRKLGLKHVVELDWWQNHQWAGLDIHLTPAQHFSGRGLFDRNKTLWGSFMVKSVHHQIYFAGDTGYGPHFSEIHQRLGAPDLALLPIGAYAPRWFMGPVHTDPRQALQAHVELGAKESVAIHFNCFQLTQEALDAPQQALAHALADNPLQDSAFRVLAEGRTRLYQF